MVPVVVADRVGEKRKRGSAVGALYLQRRNRGGAGTMGVEEGNELALRLT